MNDKFHEFDESVATLKYAIGIAVVVVFVISVFGGRPWGLFDIFSTRNPAVRNVVLGITALAFVVSAGTLGWMLLPLMVGDWLTVLIRRIPVPKNDSGWISFGQLVLVLLIIGVSLAGAQIGSNVGVKIVADVFRRRPKAKVQVSTPTPTPSTPGTPAVDAFGNRLKRDLKAFDNLVGVDEARDAFVKALQLPLERPDLMRQYGLSPVKGILLYGPPGTGKTSLARATAKYFGVPFVYKKTSEFFASPVGSTEANIREVFANARSWARTYHSRCILFFDEIDMICRVRDNRHLNRPSDLALNIILEEMDGFREDSSVLLIAATNRRDVLDPALLRPGRFDSQIEVGLPNYNGRVDLFRLYLRNVPVASEDFPTAEEFSNVLKKCAERTEGASPASIRNICQEAKTEAAIRESRGRKGGVTKKDLEEALVKWETKERQFSSF